MHGYRMLQGTLIPHSLPVVINQLGFCPLGKLRKKSSRLSLSLSHMRKLLQKQRDPWWYKEFMRSDKENGSCAFWKYASGPEYSHCLDHGFIFHISIVFYMKTQCLCDRLIGLNGKP